MTSFLHFIAVGGHLATAAIALPVLVSPAVVHANPAAPEKLWDGFSSPVGMAFDAAGNLYVAEWGAGRVSRVAPDGTRSVFAEGLSGPSGLAILPDGQSRAVADGLRSPVGLVVTPDGASLLTAAWGDGAIYAIPIPQE